MNGFKSFVDSTKIPFTADVTGVVGPNGCGKSNVIDAVKWVLGESSAKYLRSDAIADVIFTGSSSRKAAGRASVELLFDNTDASLGGEYSGFNEISIKRIMVADGSSAYYLNGTRCRRKDITDIFLGTGLGPRSYSIIEQGIISKFVEAKPEEMRLYIEEAAGISKYKERRKETNQKINSTKENISRINDLKDELENQLKKIKQQAKAAKQYQELQIEQQKYSIALWQGKKTKLANELQSVDMQEKQLQSQLAELIAKREEIEENIRSARNELNLKTDEQAKLQELNFSLKTDIAKRTQNIEHQKVLAQQLADDLGQNAKTQQRYRQDLDSELQRKVQLEQQLEQMRQGIKHADVDRAPLNMQTELADIEKNLHSNQAKAAALTADKASIAQAIAIAEVKLSQYQEQQPALEAKILKAKTELDSLEFIPDEQLASFAKELDKQSDSLLIIDQEISKLEHSLENNETKLVDASALTRELTHTIGQTHIRMAKLEAKLAPKTDHNAINKWLGEFNIQPRAFIREQLKVEANWELAFETVLGEALQAVVIDNLDGVALEDMLGKMGFTMATNTLYQQAPPTGALQLLLSKAQGANTLVAQLCQGIYVADTIANAKSQLSGLNEFESIITKDGTWIAKNWVKVRPKAEDALPILEIQRQYAKESEHLELVQEKLKNSEEHQEQLQQLAGQIKSKLTQQQQKKHSLMQDKIVLERKSLLAKERQQALLNHQAILQGNLQATEQQILTITANIATARQDITREQLKLGPVQDSIDALADEYNKLDITYQELRKAYQQTMQEQHKQAIETKGLQNQLASLCQGIDRIEKELAVLLAKEQADKARLSHINDEAPALEELASINQEQEVIAAKLVAISEYMLKIKQDIQQLEEQKSSIEQQISANNVKVQEYRLQQQKLRLQQESAISKLSELGSIEQAKLAEILDNNEQQLQAMVDKIGSRIVRLGPINLTAIDEYNEQSERYEYYVKQLDDLERALEILQSSINKIDHETKSRFKDTFATVNHNFTELFPKLFGGGKAELYLTERNLLDTGVGIVAKPPGKKVANISALSGGEKAMTAVALVLAIFQLNPSPFCMLDEVDAPLDDANVGRFCKVIKEMSETVQFIVITHNKVTMEIADQLSGVTMQEPGVSRIVSVDIQDVIDAA